jgi:hypothetical protein
MKDAQSLSFLDSLDGNWKLFAHSNPTTTWCETLINYNADGINAVECKQDKKFFEGDELSYLFTKPVFDNTHHLVYNYANGWTIDPSYIKQNLPKSYYKENPDGSIDVELVLYFVPQSYFYLGLLISGTTLLGAFGYLAYDWRRRKAIHEHHA